MRNNICFVKITKVLHEMDHVNATSTRIFEPYRWNNFSQTHNLERSGEKSDSKQMYPRSERVVFF